MCNCKKKIIPPTQVITTTPTPEPIKLPEEPKQEN